MNISTLSALVIGLFFGLIVNYLADVLPVTRRLTKPFCITCRQPIAWVDYILNRPCKSCHRNRSFRNILTVIGLAIISGLLWLYPLHLGYWPSLLITSYFGLVIIIDIEHHLVMHPVSLAGALGGMAFGFWKHGAGMTMIGGLAGFLIMLVLYYLGICFVRLISRKREMAGAEEAIGFGDVTLSAVMGLFLGWPGLVAGILLTIVLGGIVSLVVLIVLSIRRKYQAYSAIPYAPFISIATVILLALARP